MSEFVETAIEVASALGEFAGNLKDKVVSALADDPYEILAYRGYGSATHAWLHGRVLEKRGVSASTDKDSILRNLLNTYRRAEADPIPDAQIKISYSGATEILQADNEGFFDGWVKLEKPPSGGNDWQDYDAELTEPKAPQDGVVKSKGEILIPSERARFAVISDIDDTVIQSRIASFLQAARTVMLGNARTRLPFPGVAAFYQALASGKEGDERNPIFYVSSSPWNIYDVITEFLDLQKIPKGPVILRDWDIGLRFLSSSRHFAHKGMAIREIMRLYPELQFILIGDSSQHDPEIYSEIVSEFPNRVRCIYIRDVTRSSKRSMSVGKLADKVVAAGSTLVLSEDTLGAAKHAAEQGWIRVEALNNVNEEKKADEGRDDSKVPTPEGGQPTSGEAATVIE